MNELYLESYRKRMPEICLSLRAAGLSGEVINALVTGIIVGAAWEQDQTRSASADELAGEILEYMSIPSTLVNLPVPSKQ